MATEGRATGSRGSDAGEITAALSPGSGTSARAARAAEATGRGSGPAAAEPSERPRHGRRARRRPGRPPRAIAADTRGEVLDAAGRLFAARGFDGVGMRDIAEVVGVDVATVHHHAGSKAGLYEAAFAATFEAERAAIAAAAARLEERLERAPEDVRGALHELLEAYLDFVDANPHVVWLWLRRWLEPAEHAELDAEYSLPLYRLVEHLLERADRRGLLSEPQPHAAVRSMVWAVHGHVTALAAAPPEAREGERATFRAFAHRLVDALWSPP